MSPEAKSKASRGPRTCAVCGDIWKGPTYAWDAHYIDGEMVDTCSPECRKRGGYKERRNFGGAA